jgi:hypothetical protein
MALLEILKTIQLTQLTLGRLNYYSEAFALLFKRPPTKVTGDTQWQSVLK